MTGLIARSDNTGLGVQTWEFYKHMKPDKVIIADISRLNRNVLYNNRFEDARVLKHPFKVNDIGIFVTKIKKLFVCETAYNPEIYRIAKRHDCKTFLQYNYEFLDIDTLPFHYQPDHIIAPSTWNIEKVRAKLGHVAYLPVPVNRDLLPYVPKYNFKRFLHIAGTVAMLDRNGTEAVMKAWQILNRKDIQLVVKCQDVEQAKKWNEDYPNIEIDTTQVVNYWELYKGFDCLLLPRKYGGLCLPMQEALSCGMPVIMTDISPNNDVLPKEWLIKADYSQSFMSKQEVDVYEPDVLALADKIELMSLCGVEQSEKANELADKISWHNMKEKYLDLLHG